MTPPCGDRLSLDLRDERISRECRLRAWLAYHDTSVGGLARWTALSHSAVSLVISGKRSTPRVVAALASLGVPRELLPVTDCNHRCDSTAMETNVPQRKDGDHE